MPTRLLIALVVLLAVPTHARQARPALTAFTHVNVIDVNRGRVLPDMTVVIDGNRIATVAPSARVRVPSAARIIDAPGKYLIPGLWDMHVHIYDERYLPLFTANGVTGVRQMWGNPVHQQWRARMAKRQMVAPRQVVASAIIDGPKPVWPSSVAVDTPQEARQAVSDAKAGGADFIKVYALLSRDSYFAIVDEAKKRGLPVAGHVPDAVSVVEASRADQRSVEHLTGILLAASSREAEFRGHLAKALVAEQPYPARQAVARQDAAAILASYDAAKAAALYELLAKNRTAQVPTLVVNRAMAYLNDAEFRRDERLKYIPKAERTSWDPTTDFRIRTRTADDWAQERVMYKKLIEVVGQMQRHNVPLLAGTDTTNPYCFPGFSLHDELALLVEAGLTPVAALRSATSEPAAFLGMSKTLGSIEVGKAADLVLLDADPLQEIRNTSKIATVVMDGHVFDRPALDQMLREVERIASLPSVGETIAPIITERGVQPAVDEYRRLKRDTPQQYEFEEGELNTLGYQLLRDKRLNEAIEIFRLNVEVFPESSNTYDSLGEAYMLAGNKELAIRNYERSLQLDPRNTNAVAQLRALRGK